MHDKFIQAIHDKSKIDLHFFSKEDGSVIVRKCAPMDFGPSRKFKDGINRYHVWDYFPDSGKKPHPIPLEPNQIKTMNILEENFDPAEFITWSTKTSPWHVQRDWGQFS
ncbi:hypothetical protein [Desulforegula conservatrix]|uniref:hypothetical protein n=1 Tax=Desulforegula conservatrix TaxID=153026 RepID=UPI000486B8C9|nr:hypothetical protein [Desulforegula conservatrix]